VASVYGCWDVLGGCQGVAMWLLKCLSITDMFWVVARVLLVVTKVFECYWYVLGGCQGVAMWLL